MTLKQLRYFCQIAATGTFAGAARQLFIAQPTLSQQIGQLENDLGVELFQRQPRGVVITQAGETLLEHAQTILRQVDSARADVSSTAENPQGTVVLGLTQGICNVLPLYLMEAVGSRYPGITLDINAGLTSNLRQWLLEGSVDVAVFSPEETDTEELDARPLIIENLYFITSRASDELPLRGRGEDRCIHFKDLESFEFILPSMSRDNIGTALSRAESKTGIILRKRAGLGQLMANLSFVMAGECQCLLPWTAIHHQVEAGLLTAVPVAEPDLRRQVSIVTARSSLLTAATRKVITLVEDCTRQAYREGKWPGEWNSSASNDT